MKLLGRKRRQARRQDKKDETSPLTLAAANGDLEIVTYLLDHKADIDLPGALARNGADQGAACTTTTS